MTHPRFLDGLQQVDCILMWTKTLQGPNDNKNNEQYYLSSYSLIASIFV